MGVLHNRKLEIVSRWKHKQTRPNFPAASVNGLLLSCKLQSWTNLLFQSVELILFYLSPSRFQIPDSDSPILGWGVITFSTIFIGSCSKYKCWVWLEIRSINKILLFVSNYTFQTVSESMSPLCFCFNNFALGFNFLYLRIAVLYYFIYFFYWVYNKRHNFTILQFGFFHTYHCHQSEIERHFILVQSKFGNYWWNLKLFFGIERFQERKGMVDERQ